MSLENDQARLTAAVRALAPSIGKTSDIEVRRAPAICVIDCILSLNRRYDGFVVKRLAQFEREYPNVRSVSDLQALIASFSSPHQFLIITLNYNHEERGNTLSSVVNWLVSVIGAGSAQEQPLLEQWARNANPEDYASLHIRGFALAGFQYLRMLFGANTTKPDIWICRFVASNVGHKVKPIEALRLLEKSASQAGIFLRDLDATIWTAGARGPQFCNHEEQIQ